jgi:hypothetical protein
LCCRCWLAEVLVSVGVRARNEVCRDAQLKNGFISWNKWTLNVFTLNVLNRAGPAVGRPTLAWHIIFFIRTWKCVISLRYMYRTTLHNILFSTAVYIQNYSANILFYCCSIYAELQCKIYYFLTAVHVQNYSAQCIIFLLQYMYRITVHNVLFSTVVSVQNYSAQYIILLLQYIYRITVHNILFSYCSIFTELQCTIYYFITAVYVQNYSAYFIIFTSIKLFVSSHSVLFLFHV